LYWNDRSSCPKIKQTTNIYQTQISRHILEQKTKLFSTGTKDAHVTQVCDLEEDIGIS
jgi:hypothetical protein